MNINNIKDHKAIYELVRTNALQQIRDLQKIYNDNEMWKAYSDFNREFNELWRHEYGLPESYLQNDYKYLWNLAKTKTLYKEHWTSRLYHMLFGYNFIYVWERPHDKYSIMNNNNIIEYNNDNKKKLLYSHVSNS